MVYSIKIDSTRAQQSEAKPFNHFLVSFKSYLHLQGMKSVAAVPRLHNSVSRKETLSLLAPGFWTRSVMLNLLLDLWMTRWSIWNGKRTLSCQHKVSQKNWFSSCQNEFPFNKQIFKETAGSWQLLTGTDTTRDLTNIGRSRTLLGNLMSAFTPEPTKWEQACQNLIFFCPVRTHFLLLDAWCKQNLKGCVTLYRTHEAKLF